jgi:hypothetical protein
MHALTVKNTPVRSFISGRAYMERSSAIDSNKGGAGFFAGMNENQIMSALADTNRQLGMDISPQMIHRMVKCQNELRKDIFESHGMDDTPNYGSLYPTVTEGSVMTPVQFVQTILPGTVLVQTAARKSDEIAGMTNAGQWRDEEVVQLILERTGTALEYGDTSNVPFAGFNTNFNRRTIVRFEEGFQVLALEEDRASAMRIDMASEKRAAAMQALEINRNKIFFFGYNNGINRTYGLFNDPGKPPYVVVATNAAGTSTQWARKTTQEIISDLITFFSGIRTSSQDLIDPMDVAITLVLPTSVVDFLATITVQGISVKNWITQTYTKVRIVSAPELQGANGGSNVAFVFADSIQDGSTDGGQTIIQVVPTKYKALGVVQIPKGFQEDASNATAGCIYKRPWAVYCASGI